MQRVVDRQEVMRLSLLPGKDQPVQMIRASSRPRMRFRELSSSDRRPEAVEELMQETFSEPFDLVQGPLYRVTVLRRGADDHLLILAIHHAIADGWTLGAFVQDLCAAYALGRMGVSAGLPPVQLSYSAWGAAERAFWQPAKLISAFLSGNPTWREHNGSGPLLSMPHVMSGPLQRSVSLCPGQSRACSAGTGPAQRRHAFQHVARRIPHRPVALDGRDGHRRRHSGGESKQAGRARDDGLLLGHRPPSGTRRARPAFLGWPCAPCIRHRLIASPMRSPLSNSCGRSAIRHRRGIPRSLMCALHCKIIPSRMLRCRGCRSSSGCAPPARPVSISVAKSQRMAKRWRWCGYFDRNCFPKKKFKNWAALFEAVLADVFRSPDSRTAALTI